MYITNVINELISMHGFAEFVFRIKLFVAKKYLWPCQFLKAVISKSSCSEQILVLTFFTWSKAILVNVVE